MGKYAKVTSLPWTHFYVDADGTVTGFMLDTCEHCGQNVQAPNGVTFGETPERLQGLGLIKLDTLPPEIFWVDDLGATACDNCWPPER